MSKQMPHNVDDPLRESLRREDLGDRPAFSETLHERIVLAIKARDAKPAATPRRPAAIAGQPYFRWTTTTAVAGALLIAIGASWWWLERPSPLDRGNVEEIAKAEPSGDAGQRSPENGESSVASEGLPAELAVIRRLTAKAADRLDLWNRLAMLEPSPKNLLYDDVCRAANAMLASLPKDSTQPDE